MNAACKYRMLVVDDEASIRALLARLFASRFQVDCACSVDEGLRMFMSTQPDIVLIDYNMPGKNGIQGLAEIRAMDPLVSTIMISGSILPEEADSVLRQGADAFVMKPFEVSEIIRVVAGLVADKRGGPVAVAAPACREPEFSEDPHSAARPGSLQRL